MANNVEVDETQIPTAADPGRSAKDGLIVIIPPRSQRMSVMNFAEDPTSG